MTKSSPTPGRLWWVAVMAYRGIVCHVQICTSHNAAAKTIADYLCTHHGYDGASDLPSIAEWVSEHEPDFDVQIVEQACANEQLSTTAMPDAALQPDQFIVISLEQADADACGYSAWLYEGPLDFESAFPVRFGLGPTVTNALNALADELRADSA